MSESSAAPLELHSALKRHTYEQDKTIDPATTVRRTLASMLRMGDLSSIDLDERAAVIDGAYSFDTATNLFGTSGKGLTAEQAQASAVMEFAERYSWLHYDYESLPGYTFQSHRALAATGARTVRADYFLSNYVPLADREALLEEIRDIPLRFVPGFSLTTRDSFQYPLNWHNMVVSSNGLASGNTMEEAVLHGLCEVIERDNIYRLLVERRPGNDIDPDSVAHPLLRRVMDNGRAAGIDFVIKEISYDLGVPTFMVQGTRAADAGTLTHSGVGQGCHPDPEKALIRAFSEYFEGYSAMKRVPQETGVGASTLTACLPRSHFGFHVMLNPEMLAARDRVRPLTELPSLARDDIRAEIELLIELLRRHEREVVVIDKSFAPLGIPVARVLVPGARNCLNNDIECPSSVMSVVYHEAGDSQAAMAHLARSLQQSPYFAFMRQRFRPLMGMLSMVTMMSSSMIYRGDYRHILLRANRMKKDALGRLGHMGDLGAVLDSTLSLLQGG